VDADGWFWEVRRTSVNDGAAPAYRRGYLETVWPRLESAGARPLALFNGLIGAPVTAFLSVTGYPSFESYLAVQATAAPRDPALAALIHDESVRLMADCGERPRATLDPADRRAVYGVRSFVLPPESWDEFVHDSAAGVWPRIESQGACILGMFKDVGATTPTDALLLTGYNGPAHWEATRGLEYARPDSISADEWARAVELSRARAGLVLRSSVTLMSAHWPA